MKYTHETLLDRIAAGEELTYVFFWGHTPGRIDRVGKSCLSQWFERAFVHKAIRYPTAEHWMMAEKARLFEDEKRLQLILRTASAKTVKDFGRSVANFDEETWREQREKIVKNGNYLKFSQHADLRGYLLGTGNRILVEASPYDKVWGIGMKATDDGVEDPANWRGENLLGYALMEVRDRLG